MTIGGKKSKFSAKSGLYLGAWTSYSDDEEGRHVGEVLMGADRCLCV